MREMEHDLPRKTFILDTLFQRWKPALGTEIAPLELAIGRVPARSEYAEVTIPVKRASMADGVAVKSEQFADGRPDTSGWKLGKDFVRADTGDDFPDDFDAIIVIEDVDISAEGALTLHPEITRVKPGENVRASGTTVREGELLVRSGRPLLATDLAALAMGGKTEVEVARKPRVAFIPTGSELIPMGTPLKRGQNIDSNSIMARQLLLEMGAEPVMYPIVKDAPDALREALTRALEEVDVVLINGGSSKGEEDFNVRLLREEGEALFHKAACAPGKPMAVGLLQGKPVIVVPGPPIGTQNVLEWCVRPVVCRALGIPDRKRQTVKARLTAPLHGGRFIEFFSKIQVSIDKEGRYLAKPVEFRQRSTVYTFEANAYFYVPMDGRDYAAGDEIEVCLLRNAADIPAEEEERNRA